jgi:hypothetical protein
MIEIKDLLKNFNNIILSREEKKISIANVLSNILKTKVSPNQIEIKNNTICLDIKPIFKSEIFLKQEQISLKLKEILGEKTATKIR